jgi:uncharacterized membrane protein
MAKLAIYMNETGKSVLHRAGFSWMAAIVPPIWAFQHRLYKTFGATIVIFTALDQAIALIPSGAPRIGVQFGVALIQLLGIGFGANLYHRIVLEYSGYFMTSAEPGRLKCG